MKSADAPYLLVLSCADALAELVKVRALANQAESFRPKLGDLSDYLAKYHEVRNDLGKRLSSGRLNDAELTLVRDSLLSLSELSDSLGALAANSEAQLGKNLPALAHEMANEISSWEMKASQSGIANLDEALKCGRALEADITRRFKKAGELSSKLRECRSLIENNKSLSDSQHAIFRTAADLLAEAQSTTGEKLNGLLTKWKKWSDGHEAFSKEYENLIHLLAKDAEEIDQIMAASTDGCRQSLADYYGQIATWLAEVRTFLKGAAKISSRSSLALGNHSKLKQNYSDSQNLIESLRSKIAECESIFSDEEYASAVRAARKKNFIIALLGTLGAAIGFVWLSGYASMFAVAVIIVSFGLLSVVGFGFLCGPGQNNSESAFWVSTIMSALGLCAIGLILAGAEWLFGILFSQWSFIGWLPNWLTLIVPVSLGAILSLGYAVIMCGLVFRNFLPLKSKAQVFQSHQQELPAGDSVLSLAECETGQSLTGSASRLTPPIPPLPPFSSPIKATIKTQTLPAISSLPPPKPPAQTTSAISSGSEVEPTYDSHLLEAEIPPQLLSRIRDRVKREYRGDSESQRSELESQLESYRSLQEIVAQPPEGLDGQTLAKIVSRAQREHPLDLQMQLYEVEQQIEGHAVVEHFSDSTNNSEVPSGILNKIVRRAKLEHVNNFSLQAHEVQEQMSAYIRIAELRSSPSSGMNRKQMAKAIAEAESEYPDDYSMQVYHIEQGFESDTD